MNTVKLPMLPEAVCSFTTPHFDGRDRLYTANQMNAHYLKGYKDARAAVEASGKVSQEAIIQAVARGWIHDANCHKPVDVALGEAIAAEVWTLFRNTAPPAPKAEAVEGGRGFFGTVTVGNAPTLTSEEYPGLGQWWVQLRIGPKHETILARVYADDLESLRARANAIALALNEFPSRIATPPESGGQGEEPIGWVYQHDETGRMTFCENDGINTPEVFQRLNTRHILCGPAYTHPQPSAAVTEAIPAGHLFALMMCSDPWPVDCMGDGTGQAEMVAFANSVARRMGFTDWMDAYHSIRQTAALSQGGKL